MEPNKEELIINTIASSQTVSPFSAITDNGGWSQIDGSDVQIGDNLAWEITYRIA